jgi:ABC-type lipoprotein release transport system permease subunit
LVGGLLAAGAMRALLMGVSPLDLFVVPGVTALLILIAVVACFIPARRATRLDVVEVLRAE